jgi:SAM-dependent methyltransferase
MLAMRCASVSTPRLDRLLEEAERQPFAGWDFSWIAERRRIEPLPWDFEAVCAERAARSPDLLDLGTGGGERLSRLLNRPIRTVATEAWAPNVPVAVRRLRPLGIPVVHVEGGRDNAAQGEGESGEASAIEPRSRLPFRDACFHLVTNRHEAFVASEVARVLAPGGSFLTQQVSNVWADDYFRLLDLPLPPRPPSIWNLGLAVRQVEAAGLEVVAQGEADERWTFLDIGALAWYLKVTPWAIPDFSIKRFRPRLESLHARIEAGEPPVVRMPHFWLVARQPSGPVV